MDYASGILSDIYWNRGRSCVIYQVKEIIVHTRITNLRIFYLNLSSHKPYTI
jgi:hypothetical protein